MNYTTPCSTLLWLPVEEVQGWAIHLPRLIEEGRAVELKVRDEGT